MKTKYDELHYREEKGELRNEWLRCKIGRIRMEKRNRKLPAEPVLYVIGFGATMAEAEEMVERKLGRVNGNGDGSLKMGDGA